MKICLVTNLYEPYSTGGADIYVKWIAEALRERGHEVFVVTTCPPRDSFLRIKKEKIAGVAVYRFYPLNIYWGYLAQRKPLILKPFWHTLELLNPHVYFVFKRILKREKPDIVHINNMGGFSNAIFLASKRDGRKLVYTLHDYLSVCPKSVLLRHNFDRCNDPRFLCQIYQMIKRRNLKNTVDICIAPSHFVLEMHRKYRMFGNDNCVVLRHGVEVSAADIEKTAKKREKYPKNKSLNVLYIGRVDRHKGLGVLTDAIKNTNRSDLNLHIAGSGDYLDRMRHELRDYGNVTFHGWVTGTDKENLFWQCDVCVLPSICYEVAGLVILEAYKHGLPVIGSRIGGIPEMIKQDETGLLFEPGDEKELAALLQNLSKEQLRNMELACQQAAMDHSMEHHLERLMEVYQSLGGSGR
jgi:glycosyltransferase involved in cell wall biosynthesis